MTIEIEIDAKKADLSDIGSEEYLNVLSIKEGNRSLKLPHQDERALEAILMAALSGYREDE